MTDQLQTFTIRFALTVGAVCGMFGGWWFIVPMSALAVWSAGRYLMGSGR